MPFFAIVTDIGTNALFSSVYYGTSLLRNEFTATSSIQFPYVGWQSPSWERQFPFVGTSVPLNGNERFSQWERVSPNGNGSCSSCALYYLFVSV